MPTVVIIHAAEDTLPARALAEKLRQARLTVVLEKPPGEDLRNEVKNASVAIALWSPRSVAQAALIEETNFARSKSKVFHACMQSAPTPEQFRSDKSVNLTGWRGEDDFQPWRELAKLVTDKTGVAPLPPPAPRPPSGFFQPGRPTETPAAAPRRTAPQPQQQRQAPRPAAQAAAPRPAPRPQQHQQEQEPARKGGNGLVIGLIALVAVAALGGGGYFFWSQSQNAQTTSAAWEHVDRNDASALRAFIDGDPGDYRDEAQTALAELEERSYEAASDADTIESLEAFLNDFPDSEHAIAARGRIAELRTLPQAPAADAQAPAEATNPDLVPPGSAPDASGPAQLTPPPAEPAPETPPADVPPSN